MYFRFFRLLVHPPFCAHRYLNRSRVRCACLAGEDGESNCCCDQTATHLAHSHNAPHFRPVEGDPPTGEGFAELVGHNTRNGGQVVQGFQNTRSTGARDCFYLFLMLGQRLWVASTALGHGKDNIWRANCMGADEQLIFRGP